jgi:hypothetical protein
MEIVGIVGLVIVLLVAVVLLFRSTPKKSAAEAESEKDEASEGIVDVTPPGAGPP